ncbi:MAG: NADH-quinone oxidoreductase subunit D [Caldisericales bacterium]|nr:NADH-quinone oxidoreductase subunit D [Caldisericia bacterium]NMD13820.1 NADH-quinone oxidoreductase subunit D [Caldisericales bacterium]
MEEKIRTDLLEVNFGPQHPATHGVFRAVLTLDGEVVVGCKPVLGYLHRGIEKIAERLTYQQFIPYLDRLDYVSGFLNEYPYVRAVEKLMGIEVPIRAQYIRVLMMELNRIAAHLVNVGAQGLDLASMTPMVYCLREREYILELMAEVSGSRMTFNYFRFGGVKFDLPEGYLSKLDRFIHYFKDRLPEYASMLHKNEIFQARTKNIGILKPETALKLSCTGPTLRGCGIARDLRKDEPYEIYPTLDFDVISENTCDSYGRFLVRFKEMEQSVRIIEQIMPNLPEGPVMAKVPKVIKPPAGEIYCRVEAPIGEFGVYVVSDDSPKPYRVKLRSPSFSNLMSFPHIAQNISMPDVVAAFASLAPTMGDSDR